VYKSNNPGDAVLFLAEKDVILKWSVSISLAS
jgi:hypothetical protein